MGRERWGERDGEREGETEGEREAINCGSRCTPGPG